MVVLTRVGRLESGACACSVTSCLLRGLTLLVGSAEGGGGIRGQALECQLFWLVMVLQDCINTTVHNLAGFPQVVTMRRFGLLVGLIFVQKQFNRKTCCARSFFCFAAVCWPCWKYAHNVVALNIQP